MHPRRIHQAILATYTGILYFLNIIQEYFIDFINIRKWRKPSNKRRNDIILIFRCVPIPGISAFFNNGHTYHLVQFIQLQQASIG
ncbi:hypothetical protein BDE36_0506 [Arcticibacter tournemirensis]|nr:hypothetical protein BDE36_0506 [Arcticibacter tournemirensis]